MTRAYRGGLELTAGLQGSKSRTLFFEIASSPLMTSTIGQHGILEIFHAGKPESRGSMSDASEFCGQERDALAGPIRHARHPLKRGRHGQLEHRAIVVVSTLACRPVEISRRVGDQARRRIRSVAGVAREVVQHA